MKSLKPSHRENKRYLLIENAGEKEIEKAILEYVGILGYAKASPQIIKKEKDKTIIAVNRKELDKIKASFLFYNIKIKKVSGTLKKLR